MTFYLFVIVIVIIIIITIFIFYFYFYFFILFIHPCNRKLLELFRLQNVQIILDWMVELYNLVSLSWLLKIVFHFIINLIILISFFSFLLPFFLKFYFIMFCMRSTGISQEGSTGTTTIFHGLHHFFEKGINTWRNTHNPHERTPRTISLQNGSRCQIFGAHNQQAFWTCSMEIGEEPAVIFA